MRYRRALLAVGCAIVGAGGLIACQHSYSAQPGKDHYSVAFAAPLANNTSGFIIRCYAGRPDRCYQRAQTLCPDGFEISSQGSSTSAVVEQSELIVSCKAKTPRIAQIENRP